MIELFTVTESLIGRQKRPVCLSVLPKLDKLMANFKYPHPIPVQIEDNSLQCRDIPVEGSYSSPECLELIKFCREEEGKKQS